MFALYYITICDFFLKNTFFFILFCVYHCFVYMYLCILCVPGPQGGMIRHWSPGTGVREGCELSWMLEIKQGSSGRAASAITSVRDLQMPGWCGIHCVDEYDLELLIFVPLLECWCYRYVL